MNRIQNLFKTKTLKVIPYITAGYPKLSHSLDIVLAAEKGGADMIEIGIPFSDPLADGPIIQQSSQIAINNGVNIPWIFNLVKSIRLKSKIPIVLMGYINPIVKYDQEKFLKDCREAGVDGLIIPDLPLEEANDIIIMTKKYTISLILLVAPNTPADRIKILSETTQDLIYCVAILGITGTENAEKKNLQTYLEKVKDNCNKPFIVGFGIKTKDDIKYINKLAHGAVVGSELIKKQKQSSDPVETTLKFISELKN